MNQVLWIISQRTVWSNNLCFSWIYLRGASYSWVSAWWVAPMKGCSHTKDWLLGDGSIWSRHRPGYPRDYRGGGVVREVPGFSLYFSQSWILDAPWRHRRWRMLVDGIQSGVGVIFYGFVESCCVRQSPCRSRNFLWLLQKHIKFITELSIGFSWNFYKKFVNVLHALHKWLPEINKTMFIPPPRSYQ